MFKRKGGGGGGVPQEIQNHQFHGGIFEVGKWNAIKKEANKGGAAQNEQMLGLKIAEGWQMIKRFRKEISKTMIMCVIMPFEGSLDGLYCFLPF